jgi:hypothetical protein
VIKLSFRAEWVERLLRNLKFRRTGLRKAGLPVRGRQMCKACINGSHDVCSRQDCSCVCREAA